MAVVCTRCLESAETGKTTSPSGIAGKVLFVGLLIAGLWAWFLWLIAGVFAIWDQVAKKTVCPKCGSAELIPADSERAKLLLADVRRAKGDAPQPEPPPIDDPGG
ncbi:MAG TPA: hypothetical protein VEJ18_16885 [Planctomycetota bacterium]|nr:hypothetical protein [Planctomycetota bacterium]